jgi:hypothetical protein
MQSLVLGDVLLFPRDPEVGADLLHDELRVLAEMTAGLADEGDEMTHAHHSRATGALL